VRLLKESQCGSWSNDSDFNSEWQGNDTLKESASVISSRVYTHS